MYVETEILEVIPSKSKPDRCVVKIHAQTINQEGEVRQTFESYLLVFLANSVVKGGIFSAQLQTLIN